MPPPEKPLQRAAGGVLVFYHAQQQWASGVEKRQSGVGSISHLVPDLDITLLYRMVRVHLKEGWQLVRTYSSTGT